MVLSRKGTGTLKWDSLEEIFGDADLLPVWVADMEIQSPPSVREALQGCSSRRCCPGRR